MGFLRTGPTLLKNKCTRLGAVFQACNPSYLGSRDGEDWGSRPARTSSQDPISTNSWVWWHMTVSPAMQGSTNRKVVVQISLDVKLDTFSKTTNAKRAAVVTQGVECLPSKLEAWVQLQYFQYNNKRKVENNMAQLSRRQLGASWEVTSTFLEWWHVKTKHVKMCHVCAGVIQAG
jgi:hypothetical protein